MGYAYISYVRIMTTWRYNNFANYAETTLKIVFRTQLHLFRRRSKIRIDVVIIKLRSRNSFERYIDDTPRILRKINFINTVIFFDIIIVIDQLSRLHFFFFFFMRDVERNDRRVETIKNRLIRRSG